jgi:hypothetical protein
MSSNPKDRIGHSTITAPGEERSCYIRGIVRDFQLHFRLHRLGRPQTREQKVLHSSRFGYQWRTDPLCRHAGGVAYSSSFMSIDFSRQPEGCKFEFYLRSQKNPRRILSPLVHCLPATVVRKLRELARPCGFSNSLVPPEVALRALRLADSGSDSPCSPRLSDALPVG